MKVSIELLAREGKETGELIIVLLPSSLGPGAGSQGKWSYVQVRMIISYTKASLDTDILFLSQSERLDLYRFHVQQLLDVRLSSLPPATHRAHSKHLFSPDQPSLPMLLHPRRAS